MYTIDTQGWLDPHIGQEWLLTNGIGSYSSSTVINCNTRRYHGLLCAALKPPVGRIIALSRLAETVTLDDATDTPAELSVNQFAGGMIHPRGERFLRRFVLNDVVQFEYDIHGGTLIKQVLLCWQKNVVAIRYRWTGPAMTLTVAPFVALRDFHALRRGQANLIAHSGERSIAVSDGPLEVHLQADAGNFAFKPDWWYRHVYAIEQERCQDCEEDLYTPGQFTFGCATGETITIVASTSPVESFDWDAELERRHQAMAVEANATQAMQKLLRAAKDFVVDRRQPDGSPGRTILAGYPWFADWGRDTMISLPGLLLVTGRHEDAKQVLCLFAQYVSEGMIPNRFDDYDNSPSYNTVDASLWFIHAAHEYLKATDDQLTYNTFLRPACAKIIDGYRRGTRYHIQMDPRDGLITQGDFSTQLTWMDAKCNGIAFTPRQGKAVEINALWYHGLRLMGEHALADLVRESFVKTFWISPFRGLADVVDGERRDTAIRPNQIFAVSLANSPLERELQAAVVEVVRRELLTPAGLRTLNRGDKNYKARYVGPQIERDATYHNGMVWPWLIGGFLEAYINVHDRSAESIARAKEWLRPLIDGMNHTACIGSISEIYEAEPPHKPVGACAQAWSVAEVLRLAKILGM
jgi:predicted glycogen debranching enzyme